MKEQIQESAKLKKDMESLKTKATAGRRPANSGLLRLIMAVMALVAFAPSASAAMTAEQVAGKAAAVVSDPRGVSAGFTITANDRSTKGTVKTLGSKFAVLLPEVSTWYNGKALYTYNGRTRETTVTTPTPQELLESNPLLYVKGGSAYTYRFSTVKLNGKYVLDVVPRKGGSGIRKLTITVNAKTFRPEKITVNAGGGTTTITVTSFASPSGAPASAFEYPRSRYPKAEIVDLR